jgi:hypothetical protein
VTLFFEAFDQAGKEEASVLGDFFLRYLSPNRKIEEGVEGVLKRFWGSQNSWKIELD